MKHIVLFFLLSTSVALTAQTDFEKDIQHLLEMMDTKNLADQTFKQMIVMMRGMHSAPDEFWNEFQSEINPSELIDLLIPIYMKFYTHEDVKGMISFYQTPLGQKMIDLLPQITSESMLVGQEWGMSISERATKKLKDKGYD